MYWRISASVLFVGLLGSSAIVDAKPVPSPDFDGDGTVGFSDFVQFAGVFGSTPDDPMYQAKYDLDRDGTIGFPDFVIFARDFGKSLDAHARPVIEAFCDEEDLIKTPGFVYTNNMWGRGDITDYEQCLLRCIAGADTTYGWRWRWPLGSGSVKAYPEVIFGHKPLGHPPISQTAPGLPKRISDLDRLQVSYEVEMTARGLYNLAFEMWVTSANPPTTGKITHEVMIWVDHTIWPAMPEFIVDEVEIDGAVYDVYIDPRSESEGDSKYIAFSSRKRALSGKLNFEKFLDYLIAHHSLPDDQYVTSVELGNEVIEGTGETWLTHYEITVD